jgi:hypothetical protein
MSKAVTHRCSAARLDFVDGEVIVAPKDRDTFLISAERATEACCEPMHLQERIRRFESRFLIPLHEWCAKRADKIEACYLPLPDRHMKVFVVTKSPRFDFELMEEIAALDLALFDDGWRVGVWQLPATEEDSTGTFFNPEGALEVYAQR